jgi:hypothetical protein
VFFPISKPFCPRLTAKFAKRANMIFLENVLQKCNLISKPMEKLQKNSNENVINKKVIAKWKF